ncbi:Os01g0615400 [Oryza sativa Japonica Group]|uniref:Os01g0615400 protein n=1 Tax=Oryza sativa subsp. japonica TaxID=39947 RepID=A0A0P0V591_ORYSJ|nr:hypothetical protein EE612_004063 [Oryza sativa]BAS73160.1 Os01g0615400 [Oryza sativa Japonica Group]
MAVTTSKVEHFWLVSLATWSLTRLMLSNEISMTDFSKLNAVNDGGGPRGGLGGLGMASLAQIGLSDGSGSPLAISPTAFRNWAAPCPSNTK